MMELSQQHWRRLLMRNRMDDICRMLSPRRPDCVTMPCKHTAHVYYVNQPTIKLLCHCLRGRRFGVRSVRLCLCVWCLSTSMPMVKWSNGCMHAAAVALHHPVCNHTTANTIFSGTHTHPLSRTVSKRQFHLLASNMSDCGGGRCWCCRAPHSFACCKNSICIVRCGVRTRKGT